MQSYKHKIAVWGLGKHALKNIIPALDASEQMQLLGVFSRNHDVVEECCTQYRCKTWASEEDFLNDPELDVIYVSTPIALHAEQGKKILSAGKHFWCEKPLAKNLNNAKELVKIANSKGLTIFEGFMYLYHPQFIWLKEQVQQQYFGELKTIICRFGLPFLESPGFRYSPDMGGSSLLDVGCYPLSAVLELLDDEDPVLDQIMIRGMEGYEVDMEGKAVLHYSSGLDATIEWAMGRAYRNEIDIWGTKGSVFTDKLFSKPSDFEPVMICRAIDGKKNEIRINSANHFELMFRYFAEILRSKDDVKIKRENHRLLRRMEYLDKIQTQKN